MKNELYEKLLQLFVLGYEGETPSDTLYKLINDGLGGIIFFAENLRSRKNFTKTVQNLKNNAKSPLFLSIDQEGGLVERTIFLDEKVEYLTPKALSNLKENDIKTHYDILAKDIKSMGLNLNFAPVVDVNSNPQNPIIGVRSFGDNPETVSSKAKIVIETFKENHILSCAKHYPGHGDTTSDSHKVMPCVKMNFAEFFEKHLICFCDAIKNGVDTVMVSHIYFPFFDETPTPASLSKNAIKYLKNELKFDGIIFSDDMVMGGITQNYGLKESIILALKAGIDSLIFRNITDELINAVKEISQTNDTELKNAIETAYEKVTLFKQKRLPDNKAEKFSVKINQTIIDKIALKFPVIEKNDDILPLKNDKKYVILSFDNSEIYNLSTIHTTLKELLPGYNTEEIKYPINPRREDIEKILQKTNNNTVIFLSYNPVLNSGQTALLNKISSEIILINCGMDNFITQNGNIKGIISSCCYNTPVLKALSDILTKNQD